MGFFLDALRDYFEENETINLNVVNSIIDATVSELTAEIDEDVDSYKTVENVVADPDDQDPVAIGTEVELTSDTEGAIIFYTSDGATAPTSTNGFLYNEPLVITDDIVIKAIAYKGYQTPSTAQTFTYTVIPPDPDSEP